MCSERPQNRHPEAANVLCLGMRVRLNTKISNNRPVRECRKTARIRIGVNLAEEVDSLVEGRDGLESVIEQIPSDNVN